MKTTVLTLFSLLFCLSANLQAQDLPKYEMRGVWVATVANLDWPSSKGANAGRFQRDEFVGYLDKLKAAGINAVFFQVRSESDAMYNSNYDPWSAFLTGEEGVAPDPYWDPLEFAIKEAHKRGMELHAWMNPYRALRSLSKSSSNSGFSNLEMPSISSAAYSNNESPIISERASNHVSVAHPEWLLYMESIAILNPGLPDVMQYITNVVMDVVNNYDVDGIHFDDYFYPYAPNNIKSEDSETFATYPRGFTNINDWRRDNINTMIKMVNDSIKTVKPQVKFGISPFGRHEEGYNTLYADGYAWMAGQYIDYLTPQLYWEMSRFYSGTGFQYLYDKWYAQRNNRHIYAGHGIYRADSKTFSNTLFKSYEVPNQINYIRSKQDSTGSLHFRSRNITTYSSGDFANQLKTTLYKYPALTPPMYWLTMDKPPKPVNVNVQVDENDAHLIHVSWERPIYNHGNDTTLKFAIYSFVSNEENPSIDTVITNSNYLVGITGETSFSHTAPGGDGKTYYFVTSVSTNSIESESPDIVSAGVITSNDSDTFGEFPTAITLNQNYPNPFNPETQIRFTLSNPSDVNLSVFNVLGQPIEVLLSQQNFPSGTHSFSFNATNLPSGMYFYRLKAGNVVLTKKMMLIK